MNKVINKKGISLVALVITIIVLIIFTAAVVVTGINLTQDNNQQPTKTLSSIAITTQPTTKEYEVGDTVEMRGLEVTATYSDNSTANVTSSVTYTPALTEVTQVAGTTEITVTYGGKTATEKITITVVEATTATTLGSLITGPSMYGTTVTGYNGNGIESWQVLYKQTVGTEEYVYIIPEEQTLDTAVTLYLGSNASSIISNAKTYFGLSDSFDTVGTGNNNYKATLCLLDTSVWATYKDSNLGDNVVGVIGSPTLEMMVASYNEKNAGVSGFTNLSYTVNSTGYSDPGDFSGKLYITGADYWLACPSSTSTSFVRYVSHDGVVNNNDYRHSYFNLRPVVCLKSNIPATENAEGIAIGYQ